MADQHLSSKIQNGFDDFKEEEQAYVRELKVQCIFIPKSIVLGTTPEALLIAYKEFLDKKYKFFEDNINHAKNNKK